MLSGRDVYRWFWSDDYYTWSRKNTSARSVNNVLWVTTVFKEISHFFALYMKVIIVSADAT